MSNNMVSQQLPISSMQIAQMEPMVTKVDSSGRDLQMGLLAPVSSDAMSQQQTISNDQVGLLRAMSGSMGSQGLSTSFMQSGQVESRTSNLAVHQLFTPNRQTMQMETMMNSVGHQQLSVTPKRKAPMELLSGSYMNSNKRVAQMEYRPWFQQVSTSNKGALPVQPLSNAPRPQPLPASGKKKTQMEPTSSKSGTPRSLNSKSQNAQVRQSSKVQSESSESVRSKMRESLAAALTLVSQQDKLQVGNSNTLNEAASPQGKVENNSQCAGSASAATDASQWPKQETFQSGDSSSGASGSVDHVLGEHSSTSNEDLSSAKLNSEADTGNVSNNEMILHTLEVSNSDAQDFSSSYPLTIDDVPFSDNFFVKDELLQGNGLSWVMESEMGMTDQKESQTNEEQRPEHGEVGTGCKEHAVRSPEFLASRIEEELFKLFGGVNKKYKEKGRSLLFNLKDRNNPALRERVMSGEIPPERLCSMTAEELASEELSQWRIAKAEELAQMVVLPDDVDLRRLVKKTHKGEFQVEVEHDDSVSVVVSGGATSAAQSQTKSKDVETPPPSNIEKIKSDTNSATENSNLDKDNPPRLTIPSNDGTDPMHGLMADDALKDTNFLPPIVSLDEFMESLHSEPPFESVSMESGKSIPVSDKDDSEGVSELKSSKLTPNEHDDDTPDKSEKVHKDTYSNVEADLKKEVSSEPGAITSDGLGDIKLTDDHADLKLADVNAEVRSTDDTKSASSRADLEVSQGRSEERYSYRHSGFQTTLSPGVSKGESIWEGTLQLNILATQPVIGIFKSGEKTSVKDWPRFLEIKGRVRLDAFDKFLQELPMSRSRAIMAVHFVSKESSPKNEKSTLREEADSYILDDRVGFAEPVPRVELYFCPPNKKTVEMLSKVLSKEQIEAFNAIDNGLIGVIIWRKTHLTSIVSPTSSSHHKHSSKKQNFSSRRQQDANMNPNLSPKPGPAKGFTITDTRPTSDDDDIPPGFGPAVARDEDDLPEFNFSGGVNPSPRMAQKPIGPPGLVPFPSVNQTTSRPLEQMRELVHKYGQNKTTVPPPGNWQDKFGATIQPWNDDDDDIPEWQPQTLQNQFPTQQQHTIPHSVNQSYQPMMPMQSRQPPLNVTQQNFVPQRVPSAQGNILPVQGVAWRQNIPRSRGL
ncbi:hypothetical protein L6164_015801 [Bauhinia variegata]|uniref:Uncharacterized protein n=1 Tax=Bauhinia variegata TaxID=167791 RepID=A0ACB9NN14_BAUVA|nr:hypothetical protein L6164_015801 [Bauhinia variegata]